MYLSLYLLTRVMCETILVDLVWWILYNPRRRCKKYHTYFLIMYLLPMRLFNFIQEKKPTLENMAERSNWPALQVKLSISSLQSDHVFCENAWGKIRAILSGPL